jgi:hypothetical protein
VEAWRKIGTKLVSGLFPSNQRAKSQGVTMFLRQSFWRIRGFLAGLTDNDDKAGLAAADSVLKRS